MEPSISRRPSYQPFTSSYSSLSAKSRLYAIPARTNSSLASSVPVVAKVHQASLDAFSAGARRSSKEPTKPCTSAGEIVMLLPKWAKSAPVALGAIAEVDRCEQRQDTGGGEMPQTGRTAPAPRSDR